MDTKFRLEQFLKDHKPRKQLNHKTGPMNTKMRYCDTLEEYCRWNIKYDFKRVQGRNSVGQRLAA